MLSSRYIQFGVMSPQNMVKIAEFEITQRDLYMPESRTPIKGGVLDLRLVICPEKKHAEERTSKLTF